MKFKILFLLVLQFCFWFPAVLAQPEKDIVEKIEKGKSISELILPIITLQEMAVDNSPLLKYHDSQVLISKYRMKEEKRNWMSTLGFEASAKYGLFDNLIITQDLNTESTTSTTEQTRYSLGVTLKLPFNTVADRSNVKAARAELDKYKYQRESSERELRQLVVVKYNDVIKAYTIVEVRNRALGVLKVHLSSVEKDYIEGKIDIAEFARVNDIKMNAELEFEKSKIDLVNAIEVLTEIVGKPIGIKN